MRTKLLTMLTVLLALFSTSLKAQETTYYWYLGWDTEDWWNNLDKLTSTDNFNVTYTNEMPNTYNATNGEAYALKGTREDNYLALVIPADWPLPTLYASGKDGTYGIGSDSKSVTIDGVEYKLYSSYGTTSDPYCYINEVIYTPEHYWYVGWTQPTSLEELKTLATTADGSMSLGGAVGELYGEKLLTNSPEIGPMLPPAPCYVVIPVGYDIYDTTLPNNPITNSSFTKVTDVTIANHDVYVFLWNDVTVSGLEIYMDAERPKYYWYLGWDNEDWWSNLDKLTSTEDFNVTYTNEMPNSYNTTDGGLYALKGTREDNYWVLVIPADWPLPTLYNLTKGMDFELDPNGQLVTINGVEYKLYSSGATTSNPYCYINPGEPSSVEPEPEPETKYYWYVGNEIPTAETYTSLGQPVTSLEEIPFPYVTTTSLMPMVMFAPSECRVVAANSQDKNASISDITAESNVPGYNCYKMTAASAGARIYIASPEKFITLSILVINETMSLAVNETKKIRAFAKSYGGSAPYDGTMTWTTSDAGVAIVDNEGLVTAISAGTATLTATANDGTGVSATCVVTVEAAAVEPEPKYYWYVGTSEPTELNGAVNNPETDKWVEIGGEMPSYINVETANKYDYWYVLMPTEFDFCPHNSDGSTDESVIWTSTTSSIPGYTLWSRNDKTLKLGTIFKKLGELPYNANSDYWYLGHIDPTTMTEINPINVKNIFFTEGGSWEELIDPSAMIELIVTPKEWDSESMKSLWYVAMPASSGYTPQDADLWETSTATIVGKEYIVYKSDYKTFKLETAFLPEGYVEEEPAEPEPYVTEFEANGIHYIFLEKYVSNDELAAWVTSTNGWFPGEENTYSGDIVIPATVTYGGKEYSVMGICENAFKKCSINSLTLSEGVVYISPNTFEETHLGALYLPSTFRMWDNFFINEVNGYMLLQGCLGLETLVVSPEHPLYDSRDNCNAIIETATNTLIEGCKGTVIPSSVTTIGPTAFIGRDIVEFVIPEGVKEVKGRVFELCKNLQSVVFPTSVEVIKGNMLFQGCSSLTSVEIPQTTLIRSAEDYEDPFETPGAMVIPSSMFGECSSLKEFTIPENVTSIGSAAFFMCGNLEAITIPESVIAIGDLAFNDCNNMTDVTLLGQTPPAILVDAFNETQYEQITLNVPEGAEEAYKQHEVWGKFFKEEKEEPEGLSTSKYYRVKNVTTGLYLQVEGNNTNMKLQNKAEGLAMMQIFGLEDAAEGMYYIKAADADSRYYAHASGWNFNATTNADSKTPFTIALVEGEEGVYTLHQSVSEYQGLAGADNSEAGSPVYCNKGIDNNGKWAFEALTAEEQAAYVATLTAAAKPALEAAIAHAEGVVIARSTVLSADEVAAINAAVATAKAEKDNTADVGVLYALTDAINAAVNEAIYVWNLDELSNEVCYAVATEERGAWYSQSENLTGTTKAGVAADITDSKQQFAFVKSAATGACYLYSVSEEKFVKVEGSNTALTEAPVQTISFLAGTRSAKYPWVVALNAEDGQKQMGISNGYDPAIITFYNDLGDGGNTVRIEKVATFDATAALAAIEALETGIESPMLEAQGSQLIYDLTGRRVEKAEKGIYIVNGKKVVIK